MLDFKDKVLEIVSKIPYGKVMTYEDIARLADNEKGYSRVGTIIKDKTTPKYPVHRVVKVNGLVSKLSNIHLLKKEGVAMRGGLVDPNFKIKDLDF